MNRPIRSAFALAAALGLAALAATRAKGPPPTDLVVHEWGTFLALAGSDGASLDGMYHEEHALPGFVHARSRDQLHLPATSLKGETPVIYFYTRHRQDAWVHVRFPAGLWTQWYPQAALVGPGLTAAGSPPALKDGRIAWSVEILPPGPSDPPLPKAGGDALWNHARDVDAAFVRTRDNARGAKPWEYERFLFYRGLGRAPLPLTLSAASGGTLRLAPDGPGGVRHLFVLRVENGKGAYAYRPKIAPGQSFSGVIPSLDRAEPLESFVATISKDLESRLVASGLYAKEARAMVNTWRESYFRTDGVRALFVMPQAWTDRFIPLEISVPTRQVVRVMVGRLEGLSPERERLAEAAVRDLASPDAAARQRGFETLRAQGRYVEPVVRRVRGATRDPAVRALCDRLLLADFVTELRASTRAAADGARLHEDPLYVRAQLASLLREVGLDAEAKVESRAVLAEMKKRAVPESEFLQNKYFRASARAAEASGDSAAAADAYGRYVAYASRATTCRGCHDTGGPRDMTFFRDWWAGRKFAAATLGAGRADSVVASHEATLSRDPSDSAAALALAYLYEAQGRPRQARPLWSRLGAGTEGTVAERSP